MVIQNPYQVSPLTAVIIFDTKEECEMCIRDRSRSSLKTTHARKYIENKIAQYTEEGTLEQRRMESRHILMFRGKIIQDGHTFYVYPVSYTHLDEG